MLRDEVVIYRARKSKAVIFRYFFQYVFGFAGLGFLIGAFIEGEFARCLMELCGVIGIGFFIVECIRLKFYKLILTNRRIILQSGILQVCNKDCPLDKVDTMTVRKGFLGALLGYSDIVVKAVSDEFTYTDITDGLGFKNAIINAIDEAGY